MVITLTVLLDQLSIHVLIVISYFCHLTFFRVTDRTVNQAPNQIRMIAVVSYHSAINIVFYINFYFHLFNSCII